MDARTVAACRDGGLCAPAIVELISWLPVLQMLHRLSCYVRSGDTDATWRRGCGPESGTAAL